MNNVMLCRWEETNASGVRLRGQSLSDGVSQAEAVLESFSPSQRAAYEAERARLQRDLLAYVAEHGYRT